MRITAAVSQSNRAILANKGRSFLTILGIVIGIGSVIALTGLGQGASNTISSRISSLGTKNLTITPGATDLSAATASSGQSSQSRQTTPGAGLGAGGSSLTEQDLTSLSDTTKHPTIAYVSGMINGSTILSAGGEDRRFSVAGTVPAAFNINQLVISSGSLWTQTDVNAKAAKLVLGSQAASDLGSKLGDTLKIDTRSYTVIGILKAADESGLADPNSELYVPYTTVTDLFQTDRFSRMTVQTTSESQVDAAKQDIENTLLANHGITNAKLADFSVLSSKDLLSTVSQITGLLTAFLAGIAAISLLVGGIGIMNIMLVSVTERTREIGLRKAVGAKTRDILAQFLIEAVILTVIGGIFGIILGELISAVAGHFIGFSASITMSSIVLAVGVSSIIGVVFGLYPAGRAAKLSPIDALRYE